MAAAKKTTKLGNALNKAKEEPKPLKVVEEEHKQEQPEDNRYPIPPSRQGKRTIAAHFDPAVAIQLKRLAAENETTVQALLGEALNLLFEKYGEKPIA
ncbi:ribbon-helix-helix domain-containing protein [Tolypothrix campylonemoides VB511288_2]